MADSLVFGHIDAYGGTFLTEDRVNKVYDRGEGKRVVADCAMEVYERAGRHVATLHSYHWHKALGGFGGEAFPAVKVDFPDRAPDYEATEFMAENLACLYRLSGDTYEVHVDSELAASYGYEQPFAQGLCTYGFATRMLIQQINPYQLEKVKHIYAQMRTERQSGPNDLLLGNGIFEYNL